MPDPKTPPTQVAPLLRSFEFTVEMGDDKNRNFIWPPDQRQLRGRWSRDHLTGQTFDDRFASMPSLPGLQISMSSARREGRISDPLADPANRRLLDKAVAVAAATFGDRHGPEEEVLVKQLSEDETKTWLWHVRRFLDAGQCTLISGAVPEAEEILAMPGEIPFEKYDSALPEGRKASGVKRRYVPVRREEALA